MTSSSGASRPAGTEPPAVPGVGALPLRRRLLDFAAVNVAAFAVAAGLFLLVGHLDRASAACDRFLAFFFRHETAMVLAASMPLGAVLLVGWGHARRARRRRERAAAVAAAGEGSAVR